MTLKTKLVLAQAPLALALVLLGAFSSVVTARLGEQSRLILADNYGSVLAAERLKEALARIDAATLAEMAGRGVETAREIDNDQRWVEAAIATLSRNITEAGEAALTRELDVAWKDYARAIADYGAIEARAARDAAYATRLRPAYARVDRMADQVLAINQDAMVHKADRAARRAHQFERLVSIAIVVALGLGLLASVWLTARTLRPLSVVSAAVRRFGENDFGARAAVQGRDEIADLSTEFNRMADRLERYRQSSLGELLQAQQAAQAAIDGLPDPVLLIGTSGGLEVVNAATTRLLGVDPDRPAAEVYASADPAVRAAVERLRAHVAAGKGAYVPKGFEEAVHVATAEGERVFMPRAMPLHDERGGVAGVAVVLQDSTRLFRFDQLKSDLVATVAHEFRTPLTSLRMALHLCTDGVVGPLTDKQAALLFAARDDCERLQTMVDELLDLSRLDSGQIELHRRGVAPEAVVAAALDVQHAGAEQAGVTLVAEVAPTLGEVFVDPERLQLVFTNLLGNALRFSPARGRIVVRARGEAGGVRFEVEDQGPGIPVEHQAALFEKFFRVPGSAPGGSGLGLFIAKGLVLAHGGTIGVESAPGRGATFWFTVPLAPRA